MKRFPQTFLSVLRVCTGRLPREGDSRSTFHLTGLRLIAIAATVTALLFGGVSGIAGTGQQKDPKPQSKSQTGKSDAKSSDQPPDDSTDDQPVRLGTELVNVLFSVVDPTNHIVSDLNRGELSVTEDGRPQEIFTFRREVNLPINIAVLMDSSGSQEYTFPEEKTAAGYFLHSIIRSGKDSAALLTFQDDVDLVQGLTSSLETISRALDEVDYSRRMG
ncbi:MAG: hypothetical protein ACREAC_07405, partial [Blastocatellia bacterium]